MSIGRLALLGQRGIAVGTPTTAAQTTDSSTLTIDRPDGAGQGVLLVAFVSNYKITGNVTAPDGWTELVDVSGRSVHYKYVGASEPANYTWTFSNSAKSWGAIVPIAGGLFDAIGSISAAASPIVAPTVTAAAANSLALAYFNENDVAGVTYSTPAGWTALLADSDGTAPSSAIFTKSVGAGAVGTTSSTPTPSTNARGVQLVIKPR